MPRFIKKKRVRYPKNFRKKGATTRRPTNFNNRNAMRPSVYPFMRTFENVLALEAPTGLFQATLQDNLVVGHIEVSLNDLPSYTEFQALFNQYKINGLLLKFTPSYQLDVSPDATTTSQTVICNIWRSSHGDAPTTLFTIDDLLQIQKKQEFVMPQRKPFSRFMKLTQLRNTYGSSVNTDYVDAKPRYINTSESGTPHYGINFCFRAPDGAPLTSMSPRLLINFKAMMTFKQVI